MKFFTLVFDTITTAQKNVFRNKIRSLLTILAIFIGALTLSLTNGAASGFTSYTNSLLSSVATDENIYFVTKDFDFGGGGNNPGSDIQPYNPNREENPDGAFIPITVADKEYLSSLSQVNSVTESYFAQADYARREESNQNWETKEIETTKTSLVAMPGYSYDIRVRAKNSNGAGAWSSPISTQAFVASDIPQDESITNASLSVPNDLRVIVDQEQGSDSEQAHYTFVVEWDQVEGADAYDITYKKVVTYNEISVTQYFDGLQFELSAGGLIDNESPEYTAILSKRYHEALGFETPESAIGKEIIFGFSNQAGQTKEFTARIVGTTPNTFIQGGLVNISKSFIREAQVFQTGTDQVYLSLTLALQPNMTKQEIATFKQQLEEREYTVQSWEDIVGTVNDVLNTVRWGLNAFGIITLLAAGFGIINTLFMSVYERTREIGLMRAVGMSRLRVFSLFAIEAVLLGLWGSLLGIVTSILLGTLLLNGLIQSLLGNLESFNLFTFPILWSAFIILGIMFLAFIASIIPAIKASILNPIDALRHE